jgi:hypothetical protein
MVSSLAGNGTRLVVSFFYGFENENIMKRIIEITEQELKDLKLIRNYFGEHDKTPLEHLAYSELDKLVKKLQQADVMALLPSNEDIKKAFPIMDDWSKEDKCYELGKIRGAEWVLSLVKVRSGNKP